MSYYALACFARSTISERNKRLATRSLLARLNVLSQAPKECKDCSLSNSEFRKWIVGLPSPPQS